MKFLNLALVFIFFICTAESCFNKNKVEPQEPASSRLINASRNKDFNLDISYDNNGNPILIKSTSEYYKGSLKIIYEGEKIKSMVSESQSYNNQPQSFNYEVEYISEYEVHIPTPPNGSGVKLVFNEIGLLEKVVENYDTNRGKQQYINDYTYNADNNLIRKQTTNPDGTKGEFETYDDYDKMNNPFFAKAKIWSIINEIYSIDISTYMRFPISRNNPKILTLRDYDAGNKLVYKYDKNNFPIEIQEYVYKGVRPQKDSDYYLEEENIKLSY